MNQQVSMMKKRDCEGRISGGEELEVQEVIGSSQIAESHRIDALSDDVGEILKNGSQLQRGGRFAEPKQMTGNHRIEITLK